MIEDNADLATISETMLRAEGYRVAVAADRREGLRLARTRVPTAIMLDVLLPHAHGWEVLQALKRDPATVGIPVVVVAIREHRRLGLLLGAPEYRVKPFARDQFVDTLQRMVPPSGRPRVVVDDEPAIRALLSTVLEDEGYRVYTVQDGPAALEAISESPPAVLLLDLMLPRMDGFAVLEWVRAHPNPAVRAVPIVLITAKDITPAERTRLRAGTEQVISKVGLSFGELFDVIKTS